MDGSFAFLFAFFAVWGPGSLWLICLSVMPLVIIIAILVHLSHTFGSRLERRITQRLDRRELELERRPTL